MSQTPEYLDGPAGPPTSRGGRRTAWLAGGVVTAAAVIGGGVWAGWSFFATGPQPAEALPDSTVAYVSIDLDPSGGQKIEALRMLQKFPAFEDEAGLDADDDLRARLFEEIRSASGCTDLDYAEDVEPWLGDRFAVAVIDVGTEEPAPVVVVQVSDEDAADAGLGALDDCVGDLAWSLGDGWVLLGDDQDSVDAVAEEASSSPLSEDADFDRWTGEAGGSGILTAYLAAEAAPFLLEAFDVPAEAAEAVEATGGGAATLRFDDGGIALSTASAASGDIDEVFGSPGAGASVAELPEGTAVALGMSFADGWLEQYVDQVGTAVEDELGLSFDDLLAEASQQSGLDLPGDVETLLGDVAVLAADGGLDLENAEGPQDVPVALKVIGQPDAIEVVLDKVRPQADPAGELLGSDAAGDTIVVGPSGDYRRSLLDGGSLGDSEDFRDVVPEADSANYVVFVNVDAADRFLDQLEENEPESAELVANVRPLGAIGLSTWADGDVVRMEIRITTD